MDCSPSGSSVHGISQAGILKWVAIFFSRGSSRPRDQTHISCIAGEFFPTVPPGIDPLPRKVAVKITWVTKSDCNNGNISTRSYHLSIIFNTLIYVQNLMQWGKYSTMLLTSTSKTPDFSKNTFKPQRKLTEWQEPHQIYFIPLLQNLLLLRKKM